MDEADKGATDDHDRCEWVNVSSGTSSLGCPVQNPDSRKTVLSVFMCVLLTYLLTYLPLLTEERNGLLRVR